MEARRAWLICGDGRSIAQLSRALARDVRGALVERLFPAADRLGGWRSRASSDSVRRYVAQTTLYGYLKTRMGTKFPQYFEDDGLLRRDQRRRCGPALRVLRRGPAHPRRGGRRRRRPARSGRGRRASPGTASPRRSRRGWPTATPALVPAGSAEAFAVRAGRGPTGRAAAAGEAAFAGSIADLIRNAPVIDEFKSLDRPIVRNSIRFRWRDVRAQLAPAARRRRRSRRLASPGPTDARQHSATVRSGPQSPVVPVAQHSG